MTRFLFRVCCTATVVAPLLLSFPVAAQNTPQACVAPPDAARFVKPLLHVAQRLARAEPLTIVALGSSSTAGAGASSPAATYPGRLEAELKRRFPWVPIRVINRGVNGEEAREMLMRIDAGVLAEKPDLVIWQVGTNAVLRDSKVDDQAPVIQQGLARFKEADIDIILIDPQFAPKVLAKPEAERMVALISTAAKQNDVDLFRRFALMRYWHVGKQIAFESFLSPDALHMNDWSYACVAKLLAADIAEASTRSPMTAGTIRAQGSGNQ